ncbi:MAG: hypothetical protein JU82_02870 [Sulfuricurvum sp. MLSB]|uniref:hypothetical protein n=1 Tax=unclassified Sulfuricurvum TaxID=2632390 RepID=UPI000503CDEE|nr:MULTISPECIES: hypothetical protein [unclassified Sulfuricurvum]KFN40468.1 MAG: hypothetical protein JU82_02870 [Sulfuricurvum sp. MLSB]
MKNTLLILLLGTSLWGYGEGALYWTPHGCDEGKAAASKHGGHGKGESAMFAAMNLDGNATARLVSPDLSVKELRFNQNTVMLPAPKIGGYYAMVAESNVSGNVYSAVRYLSLHGRPVKVSPTKLTAAPKAALEIVPDPLHREHDRYTASKSYRFLVRFENKPLGNANVTLETHNTPARTVKTDASGSLSLTLPNDFKNVRTGRSENKSSEFLLTVRYDEDMTQYVSTFSMPYYVNPNDYWQSQSLGAGAIFIGFLGGLFLYRRSKKGVNHG